MVGFSTFVLKVEDIIRVDFTSLVELSLWGMVLIFKEWSMVLLTSDSKSLDLAAD